MSVAAYRKSLLSLPLKTHLVFWVQDWERRPAVRKMAGYSVPSTRICRAELLTRVSTSASSSDPTLARPQSFLESGGIILQTVG